MSKPVIFYTVWSKATNEIKEPYITIFQGKENAQYNYMMYFYWYNIIHEMSHIISKKHISYWDEEQLANYFAVAYWREYGEKKKLEEIESIVNNGLKAISNPVYEGISKEEYFNTEYHNICDAGVYAFFQFNFVLNSLQKSYSFEDVLRMCGIKDFKKPNTKAERSIYELNEELPQKIIDDFSYIIKQWGIDIPKTMAIKQVSPFVEYSTWIDE